MQKSLTAISIAVALFLTIAFPAAVSAKSVAEKRNRLTERVKAGILRLGTGPHARVEVKLTDKAKLSGYISEANEMSFVLINATSGVRTVVAYSNVAQVKGDNLSTGQKFAVAAVIVGALAIIYFAVFAGKRL